MKIFAKLAIQDVKALIGSDDFRNGEVDGHGNVSILIHSAIAPVITGRVRTPRQRREFVKRAVAHTERYSAN